MTRGFTAEPDPASPGGDVLIDTHAEPIAEPAWDLYCHALRRLGPKPTLIEWDSALPAFAALLAEAARADTVAAQVTGHARAEVRRAIA